MSENVLTLLPLSLSYLSLSSHFGPSFVSLARLRNCGHCLSSSNATAHDIKSDPVGGCDDGDVSDDSEGGERAVFTSKVLVVMEDGKWRLVTRNDRQPSSAANDNDKEHTTCSAALSVPGDTDDAQSRGEVSESARCGAVRCSAIEGASSAAFVGCRQT